MEKHYINHIADLMIPLLKSRTEQVLMEVTHFPEQYPEYGRYDESSRALREMLKGLHPESTELLDDLCDEIASKYMSISVVAYKLGAADASKLLRFLHSNEPSHEEVLTLN